MKKEKVCIIIADSNGGYPVPAVRGGAVSSLVEELVQQNDQKQLIDMQVITVYDAEAKKLSENYSNIGFTFIRSPRFIEGLDKLLFTFVGAVLKKEKAASYKSIFSLLFFIAKTSKILKKKKFDKVVLENNIPMAWAIRRSHYQGKYYYHFHNVPRINAKCRSVFDRCNGYLCVSDFVGGEIASEKNAIGPQQHSRIRTVYNCIDTKRFRPIHDIALLQEIRRSYGITEDEKVILFSGRLSKEKGIDKLLLALDGLSFSNFKVLIIGSYIHNTEFADDYQKYIHRLAEKYQEKVVFTGYISQERLPLFYNIADVAVLPSMWDEPAGLTMVEAMACGTPVITTRSGGIPEYVDHCCIVLERDKHLVRNIAESINRIISPVKDTGYDTAKGVERINKKFCSDVYLESFVEALRSFD